MKAQQVVEGGEQAVSEQLPQLHSIYKGVRLLETQNQFGQVVL